MATFEDLRASGLGGILARVLETSGADADVARTAQGLLGRLPAATASVDNYLSGTPVDAAEVQTVLSVATSAALALVAALGETAGLIDGTPGELVTRHYDAARPEHALAISPETKRMFP